MQTSIAQGSRKARARAIWMVAAVLAAFAPQAFAFRNFKVGSDGACDYTSIQDAVNAAAAAGVPPNYISIADNATYSGQAITIGNQTLYITGGLSDCSHTTPSAKTKISGRSGQSVFNISGASNVTLTDLEITGGSPANEGGGIYFGGSGSLNLVDTWVHNNVAGNSGGGIAMEPSGASVLALRDSTVSANQATNIFGGGISIDGPTTFYSDSGTYIALNSAGLGGGGIAITAGGGAAVGYVSSIVDENTSAAGGGIFVYNGATMNLFSSSATSGVQLFGNSATGTGGAVYVSVGGALCAQDFSIHDNTAQDGAAIGTYGSTTRVRLNDISCAPASPPIAMPAVACSGTSCNAIEHNIAQTAAGAATNGNTIVLKTDAASAGAFAGLRFAARNNTGGNVVYLDATGSNAQVTLANCLIAGNTLTSYDVYAQNAAANTSITINGCTIVGNSEGKGAMVVAPSKLQLLNSIFIGSGNSIVAYIPSAATAVLQYDLVGPNNYNTNQGTGPLTSGTDVAKGTPDFVDEAHGDYHQQPYSAGVDYAPAIPISKDLDGNPRNVDLPDVVNLFGSMDLGAYEIQGDACGASDTIFCNGFEAMRISGP